MKISEYDSGVDVSLVSLEFVVDDIYELAVWSTKPVRLRAV